MSVLIARVCVALFMLKGRDTQSDITVYIIKHSSNHV